jgi:hypothetical protein
MGDSQRQTTTLLDAIVDSLVHAARFTPEDQVAPTVILWHPASNAAIKQLPEKHSAGRGD